MKTTLKKLIKICKDNKINSDWDLKCKGVKMTDLGSGSFRNVYKIRGMDIVVKFPNDNDNLEHSRQEVDIHKRIMKSKRKFKAIQPFMPKIYHYNSNTGVVLMEYCKPITAYKKFNKAIETGEIRTMITHLQKHIDQNSYKWDFDIECGNMGIGKDKKYKVIDLGCIA